MCILQIVRHIFSSYIQNQKRLTVIKLLYSALRPRDGVLNTRYGDIAVPAAAIFLFSGSVCLSSSIARSVAIIIAPLTGASGEASRTSCEPQH